MRSCKAHSKKANLVNRLGILSLITFMALAVSVGQAIAAVSDLRKIGKTEPLARLIDQSDKDKTIKWLVTERNKEGVEKFVKAFQAEPLKFAEAMRVAAKAALDKGKEDFEKFKKEVPELLKQIADADFGKDSQDTNQKQGYVDLVNRMLSTDVFSEEDLKNLADEAFLEKLFDRVTLIKLALELPKKEGEKPPVEDKNKEIADLRRQLEQMGQQIAQALTQRPVPTQNREGELAAQSLAQACDKLKKDAEAALANLLRKQDELAQRLLEAQNQSQAPELRRNNDANDLLKALPGLLANAAKQQEQQIQPAQLPPLTPPTNSSPRNTDPNSAFNQNIPEKQEPEEPVVPPMQIPAAPEDNGPVKVTTNIPVELGRAVSRETRDLLARAKDFSSEIQSLMGTTDFRKPKYLEYQARTQELRFKNQAAQVSEEMDKLETELERLSKGAEAALDPNVKNYKAKIEAEIAEKTQELNDLRQSAGQAGNNEALRAQIGAQVTSIMSELRSKKNIKKSLEAAIAQAVEAGNDQIKGLKKRLDQLSSFKGKLEEKAEEAKSQASALADISKQAFEEQKQQQLMMMGGAMTSTPNVNRLQGLGNGGYPRGTSPSTLGIGSGMAGATKGTPSRGPLRGVAK